MYKAAETFITNILTPAVLILLVICSLAVYLYVRPQRAIKPIIKGKRKVNAASSSVSAMLTALAGTLGVGNISGVALAIAHGGAGAVFWMWVSSILAMAVKYAEILLASHYRIVSNDGFHGGAPIYIERAFKKKGRLFKKIFSALCIFAAFTVGSGVQSSAAAEISTEAFGIPPAVFGLVLSLFCAVVCVGKTKKISKITDSLVPFMSAVYIILSLVVFVAEYKELTKIFSHIFHSAFNFTAAKGGIIGYSVKSAVRYGVSRGLISNEAGCGTAPFAHSKAEKNPAEQGIFGMVEVFIDTVLLCTVTAVTVLAAYGSNVPQDIGGMLIVSEAFEKYLGYAAPKLLCFSVVLFAFGSIICWYFYGTECILLGENKKLSKTAFTVFFIFSVFLGSIIKGKTVWLLSDICFNMMLALNVCAILKELKTAKRCVDSYVSSFENSKSVNACNAFPSAPRGSASAIPDSDDETPRTEISQAKSVRRALQRTSPPTRPIP